MLAAASYDGSRDISALSASALGQPGAASILAQVQKTLGVSVQDLLQAVNGPAILYLKAGAPLPEVTIVVKPADAQKAAADGRSARRQARQEREADARRR